MIYVLPLIIAYLGIGFGLSSLVAWLLPTMAGAGKRGFGMPTLMIYFMILVWPLWLLILTVVGIGFGVYKLGEVVVKHFAKQGSAVMYLIRWPTRVIDKLSDAKPPFGFEQDGTPPVVKPPVVKLDNSFKDNAREPNGQDADGDGCVVYRVLDFQQLQALKQSGYHAAWQGTNDCWCGRNHPWTKAYDTSLTVDQPVRPSPVSPVRY